MKLTPIVNPVALRLDNTVGTRIFAGDTMIHGDTGWRSMGSMMLPDVVGSLSILRTDSYVTVTGASVRPPTTGTVGIIDLPAGFRASRTSVGSGVELSDIRPVFVTGSAPYTLEIRHIEAAQSWINFTITYITRDPWPTTLPGLPG